MTCSQEYYGYVRESVIDLRIDAHPFLGFNNGLYDH